MPILNVDEQTALAERLEEFDGPSSSAYTHLSASRQALGRMRQFALVAACSGRLTEDWRRAHRREGGDRPGGWTVSKLGDVAKRVTKGTTPTSYGHAFTDHGVAFIKVENVGDGRIDRSSIRSFIMESTNQLQSRSILEAGDILFSIAGTIGRTAIVERADLPANTNQALAIIRGTSDSFIPGFLVIALQAAVQGSAAVAARGSGMNNISLADVRNFEVPIPPKDEQIEIGRRVTMIMAQTAAIDRRLRLASLHLEKMSHMVLNTALGPNVDGVIPIQSAGAS